MSEGWIKLHRKILDNPTLKEWQARSVFIELLLRATHKPYTIDRKGHQLDLIPGQLVTTERLLAGDLKLGRQVIRRILGLFKNRTMIETKTNPLGTVITICNWWKYQGVDVEDNPGPTQQPTQDQPRTNPHYKNDKNEKKEESTDSESLQPTCPASPDVPVLDFDFFWSCWRLKGAKRGSKDRARKLYEGHVKSGTISHHQLCVHVERLQRFYETSGTPVSKMLHPATWLYQKRWKDELVIDQPERKTGYGQIDHERIARNIAEKSGGGFKPSHQGAREPARIGQGNSIDADRPDEPAARNREHGRDAFEFPDWFNEVGD